MSNDATKPMPRINAINRPFFAACNDSELRLQRCLAPGCGKHVYFPRVCCPHCGGGDLEWVAVSGRGTIRTHTFVRRPQHPSFFPDAPYHVLAVTLEEGPLMYSRLAGDVPEDADLIGKAVRVVFSQEAPGQKLPFFELA
ncbi:MAG: putative nucleic-acid-binding protein containing a Zn-ribbon [Rubritepida sp.]|nr:putative nucleic-acid-binding protein containing a Zn-ribbon [Rubritepida sp.]